MLEIFKTAAGWGAPQREIGVLGLRECGNQNGHRRTFCASLCSFRPLFGVVALFIVVAGCAKPGSGANSGSDSAHPTSESERWTDVSAGGGFICGLTSGGRVLCWGDWSYPSPGSNYVALSTGKSHVCAITTDEHIECWGQDKLDQLDAPSGSYTSLSLGGWFGCAVNTSDEVRCWGDDDKGKTDPPDTLGAVKQVASGRSHACAVETDRVECWGWDFHGQLGLGSGSMIAVSENYSCARFGGWHCVGENEYGQADPPGFEDYVQLSAGDTHACGLTEAGNIECWGSNFDGESDPPDGTFTLVTAGESHTCGLTSDHRVICFGLDHHDALEVPEL